MSNINMAGEDWETVQQLLEEALRLSQQAGNQLEIAFNLVKLGQVAQAQGDEVTARQRYQAGLAILEQLGMPEAAQVRAMLDRLDAPPVTELDPAGLLLGLTQAAAGAAQGESPPAEVAEAIVEIEDKVALPPGYGPYLAALGRLLAALLAALDSETPSDPLDPAGLLAAAEPLLATEGRGLQLGLALNLARLCDALGRPDPAVEWQGRAIALLRDQPGAEIRQTLGVALYNQADYLAQLGRYQAAVVALEEVVAIDQELDLPDLAEDEAALAAMQGQLEEALAAASPEETALPGLSSEAKAALEERLAGLPVEEQARIRGEIAQFMALSPQDQQALIAAEEARLIESRADQLLALALEAAHSQRRADMLLLLDQTAADLLAGRDPASAPAQLGQFSQALAALLRGQTPPPIAPEYTARLAQLAETMNNE